MYYSEQHTSISTSPYTTVYYIKVLVSTNWKGKVCSSFQNGLGPQAVVVLFVASPNATSIYGDTKLRSCVSVCVCVCVCYVCVCVCVCVCVFSHGCIEGGTIIHSSTVDFCMYFNTTQ